jgi:penicillin amidase
MAGTSLSPLAASWRAEDFRVMSGASFRMVLDVGNWDASRFINTPGQSGDVDSPHARDLFETWVKGGYVPLVYSREAVEAATADAPHPATSTTKSRSDQIIPPAPQGAGV